jgi:hypothetical protein
MLFTLKGLPAIDEENIKNDFKKLFIENYTKINKDQKSSDLIVSDLVKSSFRKIIKNLIQKKPEIEVHLIRS